MIATTAQAVNPMVTIRIIGDRVSIKLGVPVSCDCPARRKVDTLPCKHMIATREALAETAHTGLDVAKTELVPQTRKPKPAPTLASLYSTKPAPTWTDAQRRALAAHFAEFEVAVW